MSEIFELKFIDKREDWHSEILNSDASFTQSYEYGEWQESVGRKVIRFCIKKNDKDLLFAQFIKFSLPLGHSYLYSPYGPVYSLDTNTENLNIFLKKQLSEIGKNENSVFVRVDPTPREVSTNAFFKNIFKIAPEYSLKGSNFQLRVDWQLPLQKSLDEILLEMHEKTRYSIRLAQKKLVKTEIIKEDFDKYFPKFMELMETTALRNRFKLHERIYYEAVFKSLNEKNSFLAVASFENQIHAIDIIFMFGTSAHFLFGGSSNEHRNIPISHAVKWAGIVNSKALGNIFYSFGAIAENNKQNDLKNLSDFKTKFGGSALRHSDLYDVVLKPFWYYLYILRKWTKKFSKK